MSIQVKVRSMDGAEFLVNARPTDLVTQLKKNVADQLRTAPESIYLCFAGHPLEDGKTLEECDITDQCVVQANIQQSSGYLGSDSTETIEMSFATRNRLMQEFEQIKRNPPVGISASPDRSNVFRWNAIIYPANNTPFQGAAFRLVLDFGPDYPYRPPHVKFVSEIFHPNVYTNGSICLDILGSRWQQSMQVGSILTAIQVLVNTPNPSSPANSEAASLYVNNRREYERRARDSVRRSWNS